MRCGLSRVCKLFVGIVVGICMLLWVWTARLDFSTHLQSPTHNSTSALLARRQPFPQKAMSLSSVQVFYYPWYGNPAFDNGSYYHWNHAYLPHWDPAIAKKYPSGNHKPPDDIGSNYYPQLGPYSSRDPAVIDQHMKWISSAGIDVVVISWFYPQLSDEQGRPWDDLIPALLDAADSYGLKVTFHMEPYKNRNALSIRRDVQYLADKYFNHRAVFKTKFLKAADAVALPMLYFYDSYLVPHDEWLKLTSPSGDLSVRNSKLDVVFIGLIVNSKDRHSLPQANFDGMYTYFASDTFTYGSTPSNWPSLSVFCRRNNMIFIPSIGPGYDDRRVRPWNVQNYKNRAKGVYYERMFKSAHTSQATIISITSFNEWHEGTQIEPDVPLTDSLSGFKYGEDSSQPDHYLQLTRGLVNTLFRSDDVNAIAKKNSSNL